MSDQPAADQPPLSARQSLLYGLGHFGLSVLGYMIVACVVPFYEGGGKNAPTTGMLIALVLFVTRLVDFVADPLVGFLSDRTHSRWGRRKPYMLVAAPLLVASFVLVWYPPGPEAPMQRAWYAGVLLTTFFVCFAGYGAPYLGLLPEIARTPTARARLAAIQGLFHLLGTMTAALVTGMLCPVLGMGRVAVAAGVLCLVTLWLALLGPHETESEDVAAQRELGLGRALRVTFTNWPFLIYWAGYYLYWVPVLLVMAGLEQIARELLGRPAGAAGGLIAIPLVGGLLLLPLARRLEERVGARRALLLGMGWLVVTGSLLAVPTLTAQGEARLWALRGALMLLSPAVALLFTVPYVVLAEVCDLDYRRSGQHREAMYFGFQGLILKAGWGVAPLIVALVIRLFGPGNLGYHLLGPVAGGMALLGLIIFWFYPTTGKMRGMERAASLG